MAKKTTIVAIAGGSGFIGRAIARRLSRMAEYQVRILSRSPERARAKLASINAEFVRADVTEPTTLESAIRGAAVIVDCAQFEGYPVENPRLGLTFERVDHQGCAALLTAAKTADIRHFVYISGAGADENSTHPAFRAKGQAEADIRRSGLTYTIFRPSIVVGQGDRVTSMVVKALRFAPVIVLPGSGRQQIQPVWVEDVAACVALALTADSRSHAQTFEVGGPERMTLDGLLNLIMDITGHHRPILHAPESLMKLAGALGEKLPRPLLSRDAVSFLLADNVCNTKPLIEALGIKLTPLREALSYLAARS
jgi:uncharacterized protein YbjT (DUF2867 family)